jgi:hypothetical protein
MKKLVGALCFLAILVTSTTAWGQTAKKPDKDGQIQIIMATIDSVVLSHNTTIFQGQVRKVGDMKPKLFPLVRIQAPDGVTYSAWPMRVNAWAIVEVGGNTFGQVIQRCFKENVSYTVYYYLDSTDRESYITDKEIVQDAGRVDCE